MKTFWDVDYEMNTNFEVHVCQIQAPDSLYKTGLDDKSNFIDLQDLASVEMTLELKPYVVNDPTVCG